MAEAAINRYICTFTFFTENEGVFFSRGAIIKVGKYLDYFGIVVVSDVLVFWALSEEVQLCFNLLHQNPAIFVSSCYELFCLVNAADFSPDSDQNTVSLEEALWIIGVKIVLMLDLFHLLSSPDDN